MTTNQMKKKLAKLDKEIKVLRAMQRSSKKEVKDIMQVLFKQ
jgi:hypothetical protein